jgi:hypothetical protein
MPAEVDNRLDSIESSIVCCYMYFAGIASNETGSGGVKVMEAPSRVEYPLPAMWVSPCPTARA